MLADFHNHLLPGMDLGAQNIDQSRYILERLAGFGIRRVFLTPNYYQSEEYSIQNFIRRRTEAAASIEGVTPRGITTVPAAELMIEKNISADRSLPLLAMGKSRYILISLPIVSGYGGWIDAELHCILHKHKLLPVFAGFDRYGNIYSEEAYLKLMTTPGAVYQFNVNSLSSGRVIKIIKYLYNKNKPIIFGTNAKNEINRKPEVEPLMYLRSAVPEKDYNYIMMKNNSFLKIIK